MNPRYYYSGTDGGVVNIVFGGVLGSGGGDIKTLAVESGILVELKKMKEAPQNKDAILAEPIKDADKSK